MPKEESVFIKGFRVLAVPLVDGLTIYLSSLLLPVLMGVFARRNLFGTLVVAAGYFLMCAGIFAGKRLRTWPRNRNEPADPPQRSGTLVQVLSWPYAIFVVVMMLDTGGAFKSGSGAGGWLDRLSSGGPLVLLPVILVFVTVMVLFPLLLILKTRPKISHDRFSHTLVRLLSVAAIDFMALVTAAYWHWQLADATPMEISLAGKLLVFVLVYIVFLMFYAPPRLALINLEPSRWSFAGYALFLAVLLWGLMR